MDDEIHKLILKTFLAKWIAWNILTMIICVVMIISVGFVWSLLAICIMFAIDYMVYCFLTRNRGSK